MANGIHLQRADLFSEGSDPVCVDHPGCWEYQENAAEYAGFIHKVGH